MSVAKPLIMHVVYRFDVGGLENGVVNLINHLDSECFRHVVVAMTKCDTAFCDRIASSKVEFFDLDKPPGHGVKLYAKLHSLISELQPTIVHTRNLAALEAVVPAWLAGVPIRLHGEHGWDVSDPDGKRFKYRLIRRLYRPFVSCYVALSGQLEDYLRDGVGVQASRITRICNGVDTARFHPGRDGRSMLEGSPFNMSGLIVLGTVGRLQAVKDQANLVHAFARVLQRAPQLSPRLRLMIVGDGPLRAQLVAEVTRTGLEAHVWFAGARDDIPNVMRAMDLFVLPSRAEGISNTILEAMASGLPVIATDVGGCGELVVPADNGALVPANDSEALAQAIIDYVERPAQIRAHGIASRERAVSRFSIQSMVAAYHELYAGLLAAHGVRAVEPEAGVVR
ncbi:TIGR03088 family PEP-CTERM/XrtA system glycosyltransferase [Azoarcus sp. L1K30]|uniref:TIGR03088 family PEP-CTERM/XrtA system glycosyltransferase n=1 Tax=Azoarcus sp. L1K30 TaxID=2820277 RepID=UPI001B829703|nr:TIGR03088 family PEP-CTERM/XrtA system glycosyltransferase [Azoarcus sp. L1K30]MBR0568569.1 TIGR03088 family PEP-CTERM/XrtA system glycosyltransferase [Azoarcus sp. L1K30]